MTTLDPDVRRTLDLRLARGEVTVDEYRHLIAEIQAGVGAPHKPDLPERLIAEVDELRVYSKHIEVAGRNKSFEDVASVDGGSTTLSLNLAPASKHSWISVKFTNGDSYYMDEDRTVFGREHHRKICECVAALRKVTFFARYNRLCNHLSGYGKARVGTEVNDAYTIVGVIAEAVSRSRPSDINLTIDGSITNGVLVLDLKLCRSHGILELGIERANKRAPGEVYACHERSILEKSKRSALKFFAGGDYDTDVVLALLDWLADPGNRLRATP